MSDEVHRRPRGEAASSGSGQESTAADGTTLTLFDSRGRPQPWTHDLHGLTDSPRRRGETEAVAGASRSWRRDAERTIEQLAARSLETGEPFTAETVREYVGDVMGPSQDAMGGLFAAASRRGIIRACGVTTATREEAHGRVIRTWIGTGKVAA